MHKELELYLSGSKTTSVLLCGMPGIPLLEDALQAAAKILDTSVERLQVHPDYLFIDRGENKTLSVEAAEVMLAKASLKPSLAEVIVVVVHEIDAMTEAAQNKLLKMLEDSTNVLVIATAFRNTVLATIRSRMRIITYKPFSRNAFAEYLGESIQEVELLYCITGGCPGLIDDYSGAIPIFKGIVKAYNAGDPSAFLIECRMVKEKDKKSFFSQFPTLVKQLFCLLGELVSESLQLQIGLSVPLVTSSPYKKETLVSCLPVIQDSIKECEQTYYTEHNFFWNLVSIIEILS